MYTRHAHTHEYICRFVLTALLLLLRRPLFSCFIFARCYAAVSGALLTCWLYVHFNFFFSYAMHAHAYQLDIENKKEATKKQ